MKTILITGANGNHGLAAIKYLYHEGFGICAVTGSRPLPTEFEEMTLDTQQINLLDEDLTNSYVQRVSDLYAGLNGAVLLAGGFAAGGLSETDLDIVDKQIALNFKTAYNIVRPLIKHFIANGGGRFILVGAQPALNAELGKEMVAYALSKSLLFHLADIINATGQDAGVSATVLVPGTIDTPRNRNAMPGADFSKWVKPDEIAELIRSRLLLKDAIVQTAN